MDSGPTKTAKSTANPIQGLSFEEALSIPIDGVSFISSNSIASRPRIILDHLEQAQIQPVSPIPLRTASLPQSSANSSPSSPAPATPPASPPVRTPIDTSSNPSDNSLSPHNEVSHHPQSPRSPGNDLLPPSPPKLVQQDEQLHTDNADYTTMRSTPSNHPLYTDNVINSIACEAPPVYTISTPTLAMAIDRHYSSHLPSIDNVFPWTHGLHQLNYNQCAFLDPSRKESSSQYIIIKDMNPAYINPPENTRGLVIVKVGPKCAEGTLIGAVYPDELLCTKESINDENMDNDFSFEMEDVMGSMDLQQKHLPPSAFLPQFLSLDPENGISLRNFHIQVAKWAALSDIILYSSEETEKENLLHFSQLISQAQVEYRQAHPDIPHYITCIAEDDYSVISQKCPNIVSHHTIRALEGVELSVMTKATLIGDKSESGGGVYLGNSSDFPDQTKNWTLFVVCGSNCYLPSIAALDEAIRDSLSSEDDHGPKWCGPTFNFPASGSISPKHRIEDIYSIINVCKLLYVRSKAKYRGRGAGSLILCNDGYTETSFLALCYLIYSKGLTTPEAWIALHQQYNRPFFAFQIDTAAVLALEPYLLKYSPAVKGSLYDDDFGAVYGRNNIEVIVEQPAIRENDEWFKRIDGSLPSRILPHMYLGSLTHAENPEMLQKLGIKRILSVGEKLSWVYPQYLNDSDANPTNSKIPEVWSHEMESPFEGITKILHVYNVEDDGIDPLTPIFERCIDFLDEAYRLNEPTLVHCRVGVSRSATVCIAEVMKRLSVGLPRAYLFVRVRRLNVIIQPHLRFMYELMKWEEDQRVSGNGWLREADWPNLCREISLMNRAYIP